MSIILSKEFTDFVTESIVVGQKWFSNENRKYIYGNNQAYYTRLDFEDDHTLLHPLLMNHYLLKSDDAHLDQLVFNKLNDQKEFQVRSNADGLIYLAGTGSIKTSIANADLIVKKEADNLLVFQGETQLESHFYPLDIIPNTSIELPLFELPIVRRAMSSPQEVKDEIKFDAISKMHREKILESCAILEREYPQFFLWLKMVVRAFQVYDQPKIWSHANVSTFGISYLSANPDRSILFFLEDIIHQSSHNILYAVNYFSKDELFAIPASSTMNDFLNDGDDRNIYGVFHGLFTQSNINIFFNICLDREIFEGRLHHELTGRLADNMKRWKKSLEKFAQPGALSEIGEQYFHQFNDVYEQVYAKWGDLIEALDLTNQPYIFSYKEFAEANPMSS